MEDRTTINRISQISIAGRLTLFLVLIVFWYLGGFRPDQVLRLCQVIAPMTILYLFSFAKRLVNKPFPVPRGSFSRTLNTYVIGFPFLIYLLQIILIIWVALLPKMLAFDTMINIIFSLELYFAFYAATSLDYLFKANSTSSDNQFPR